MAMYFVREIYHNAPKINDLLDCYHVKNCDSVGDCVAFAIKNRKKQDSFIQITESMLKNHKYTETIYTI